jgi:hypothetical protein
MLEFDMLMLPLDANIQEELKTRSEQGWIMVPGTKPQVIYQICRPIQQQQAQAEVHGFGKLSIDESKLYIIDKDGNRVERH